MVYYSVSAFHGLGLFPFYMAKTVYEHQSFSEHTNSGQLEKFAELDRTWQIICHHKQYHG